MTLRDVVATRNNDKQTYSHLRKASMHTTHNVQHPQNLSTQAPASTDEATMNMPDETTVTFNEASTSVPEPAAVQAATAIVPTASDGTTLALNEVPTNSFLQGYQGQHLTVVMGNYTNTNNNNYAGATVNNAERQTIYTGGGAPNGTGGSPTVTASVLEAAVADLTKLCQDIQENVTGQGERLQTTMAQQIQELKSSMRKTLQELVATHQTPMTGEPNRQHNSTS